MAAAAGRAPGAPGGGPPNNLGITVVRRTAQSASAAARPPLDVPKGDESLKAAAAFLIGALKKAKKTREGALSGKKVSYFRCIHAAELLQTPDYAKSVPAAVRPNITSALDARRLLDGMLDAELMIACTRYKEGEDKIILEAKLTEGGVEDNEYYIFRYDPPSPWRNVIGVGLVLGVLAIIMFPLWPYPLRLGVSYLATGVLAVLIAFLGFIATVRPLFWFITRIFVPPGIWILPNINEDMGFFESFRPAWDWDKPVAKKSAKDTAAGAAKTSGDSKTTAATAATDEQQVDSKTD